MMICFLSKRLTKEDWFKDNKAVLTGSWAKTYNKQLIKTISHKIKNLLNISQASTLHNQKLQILRVS